MCKNKHGTVEEHLGYDIIRFETMVAEHGDLSDYEGQFAILAKKM